MAERPRPIELVAPPEAVSAPGPVRDHSLLTALVVLGALVAVGLGLRLANPSSIPALQNFLLIFGALMVEALPFVLLGAVVSAAVEVFVPARVFERLGRTPGVVQVPVAAMGGFAFPVCECGSVPVARRLVLKGLSPVAAVTFMLAAPVLNPIVLVTTAIAYRGRGLLWPMVGGRAALSFVVAVAAGWVLGARGRDELLRARKGDECADGTCGHDHGDGGRQAESRGASFFGHLTDDFMMMAKYLVVGAAAAATIQTFLPSSFIDPVANTPVLSMLALMGLATALSLCSQSDAFVAASLVQFGPASQLAFLVFGPMVDAKLLFLYRGTFSKGFVRNLVVTVATVTLAGTLWMELLLG